MKCLIIQPGPYGDIILVAPIAKYYADRGYEVYWPCRQEFYDTLKKFSYVNPLLLNEDILHEDWLRSDVMKIWPSTVDYDLVINLADRGPHPTAQMYWENFEECKYRLGQVPMAEKHKLSWTRDIDKEDELYDMVVPKDTEYAFYHNDTSDTKNIPIPVEINIPKVKCKIVEGFSIFDWYKVIVNAKEIYTVESSVHQFMDGFVKDIKTPEKYLISRGSNNQTLAKFWNKKYYK